MRSNGFTLAELIVAFGLFSLVLLGMMHLITMLLTAQINRSHGLGAQGDASLVLKSLQIDLRQATQVSTPPASQAMDTLSGCVNYDPAKGAGAAGVLSPGQPNWSFYYCVDSSSALYRYSAAGPLAPCPLMAPPVCGVGGPMILVKNFAHSPGQAAYFIRSATGNDVAIHYQTGAPVKQIIDTAITVLEGK